jgi:NADH dehydrogenase (ubiquinone) flavoprotein 2
MTGKLHHIESSAPSSFSFTAENLEKAQVIINRYPAGRQQSALMPLLTLAQRQNGGWLTKPAMDYLAQLLGMAPVRVYEVATFYTMYNHAPVGKHVIEVCTTTPCWLRGSDAIVHACERFLGVRCGDTTIDGQFTLKEVECLGACVNAPMLQIGDHYYEDLTPQSATALLDALAQGEQPKPGPQNGRRSSEPLGGPTTLKGVK